MTEEFKFKGKLELHKSDKAGWTNQIRAVTRTSRAFRNAVYEAALAAAAHFMNTGDVIRLNDIDVRLSGVDAGAVRRWVQAAMGQMVSYDTKALKWKVRKGWEAQKNTLVVGVLGQNPLDFAKVKDDPSDYTSDMFIARVTKLISVTEGNVGAAHTLPEDQAEQLAAFKPILENAIVQMKAVRETFIEKADGVEQSEAQAEEADEQPQESEESNVIQADAAAA